MPRKQAVISQPLPQVVFAPHLNKKGGVTPFDITKTTKINATVGIQFVTFAFQDVEEPATCCPGPRRTRYPRR
jgi:hypothetical protein